jgi:putative membrane protein
MKEIDVGSLSDDAIKGLLAGAAGGLAGAWTMNLFQSVLSEFIKSDEQNGSAKANDAGDDATVKTANAITTAVFDHSLTKNEKKGAGPAVHYAFGASMGGMYGMAAEVAPNATVGFGLGFGAALWLAADEVMVPALGLAKPPNQTPAAQHALALASHLVYGLTTELTRRIVRQTI